MEYKGRIQEADPDSLQKYDRLPFQSISFNAMYDALEMLKASGLIPKIKNKELTVQILTALRYSQEQPKRFRFIRQHKTALPGRVDESPRCQKKNEFHQLY